MELPTWQTLLASRRFKTRALSSITIFTGISYLQDGSGTLSLKDITQETLLTLRANSTRQSHSAEDAHPQVYADFPETFRWKGIGFSSCVLFVFNNLILFSIRIRIFFRFLPTFCCPLQLSFHPSPFPHLLLRCLFLPLPLFPHPNPSILLSSAFHPFLIAIPRPKILSPFRLSWNDT